MRKTAVIVAGGSGKRMGASVPKQFLMLADKPILFHTISKFLTHDKSLLIALVLPKAHFSFWEENAEAYLSKEEQARILLCPGGKTRTQSVQEGLLKLSQSFKDLKDVYVAIHDGVRPLIKQEVINNSFMLALEKGAAVVCVPVKSSMREEVSPGKSQAVDRSRFYHVQTPQTFPLVKILKAFATRTHDDFTDDASLYDAFGESVAICMGTYDNIKITTPEDLPLAESILRGESA